MADLLIASEYFLSFASLNMEAARGEDGRAAHVMRAVGGTKVLLLDDHFEPIPHNAGTDVTGMIAIGGPQVSPGYAEHMPSGVVAIGAGPRSQEGFKKINGEMYVVPKDLVRLRSDGSFFAVGRAGGTIKVKGGVLMATNVVEMQLEQDASINAACVTEPMHVEGGSTLLMQLEWQSQRTLRDAFQKASFLRMPIRLVCSMARNASTGKVQRALAQQALVQEAEAEAQVTRETERTQELQVKWYVRLVLPACVVCFAQLAFLNMLSAAFTAQWLITCSLFFTVLAEAFFRWCLIAWSCTCSASVANLWTEDGRQKEVAAVVAIYVSLQAALCLQVTPIRLLTTAAFMSGMVVLAAPTAKDKGPSLKDTLNPLSASVLIAVASRCLSFLGLHSSADLCLCYLLCIAANRRIPLAPWQHSSWEWFLQLGVAVVMSHLDAFVFLSAQSINFAFGWPTLVLSRYPSFAWRWLSDAGQPLPLAGGRGAWCRTSRRVSGQWDQGKTLWLDVSGDIQAGASDPQLPVTAQSPAGLRAQALARQAGVDFQGIDSLRITRLMILLQKYTKPQAGQEPIGLPELRAACVSEFTFTELVDDRLQLKEEAELTDESYTTPGSGSRYSRNWHHCHHHIHREAATQAAWNCKVDMTVEWKGSELLDQNLLTQAFNDVVKEHPLLRVRYPCDDSTDEVMGSGSTFSTQAVATWNLLAAVWSRHQSWSWPISQMVQRAIAAALWYCWPRTLVLNADPRFHLGMPCLAVEVDQWEGDLAKQVQSAMGPLWAEWNEKVPVQAFMAELRLGQEVRQFLYISITHKYADGGAVSAFLQALSGAYTSRLEGRPPAPSQHPVLEVNHQRFQRYLEGGAAPSASVDVYLFDINNQTFQYKFGTTSGVCISENTCNLMRSVGVTLACSEEIAWLSCIVCSMCRLMPHEEVLKIMIVHNGRMGEAESGAVACISQNVMLTIPCLSSRRAVTPLADIACIVKDTISHHHFRRPEPCEQAHAKINIGGMAGRVGDFEQIFKAHRVRPGGKSRAAHIVQLRMDNEDGIWCVKDFKCHNDFDSSRFWEMALSVGLEICDGWFLNPLHWKTDETAVTEIARAVEAAPTAEEGAGDVGTGDRKREGGGEDGNDAEDAQPAAKRAATAPSA